MLIFSGAQFLAILAWFQLPDVSMGFPKAYLLLMPGLWFLTALAVAGGLLDGRKWAPQATRSSAILYAGWFWVDRLLLQKAAYPVRQVPVFGAITILSILSVVLFFRAGPVRKFFGEQDL